MRISGRARHRTIARELYIDLLHEFHAVVSLTVSVNVSNLVHFCGDVLHDCKYKIVHILLFDWCFLIKKIILNSLSVCFMYNCIEIIFNDSANR